MLSTLQAPYIQCFVCTRCSIIISSMISLDESGQHEAVCVLARNAVGGGQGSEWGFVEIWEQMWSLG